MYYGGTHSALTESELSSLSQLVSTFADNECGWGLWLGVHTYVITLISPANPLSTATLPIKDDDSNRWTGFNSDDYTENNQNLNNTMTYREPLPDDCPPDEADEITSPRLVYRLVRGIPPTNEDFPPSGLKNPLASSTFPSAGHAVCPCSPTSAMRKGKPDDATSDT